MHEIGITEDLIKSIREELDNKKEIKRVKKIYVHLGENSSISEESLRFWFENLSKGTELQGVSLEFISGAGNKILVDSIEVE